MVDFKDVYQNKAEAYDRMVSFEDYEENLPAEMSRLLNLKGAHVVELGAGTGRLTRILARQARSVTAIDRARAMLGVARANLQREGLENWQLVQADIRDLPVASRSADIAVAGWAIGHSIEWFPESWRKVVSGVMNEIRRVVVPNGSVLILETLGTGRIKPEPPDLALGQYYDFLEQGLGFQRSWVRTDYAFETPEQGAETVRFFFGDALAETILRDRLGVLPECTGLWIWRG